MPPLPAASREVELFLAECFAIVRLGVRPVRDTRSAGFATLPTRRTLYIPPASIEITTMKPILFVIALLGLGSALHAWGQPDPVRFGWFEPPPAEALAAAQRLLSWLGALGADGRITPLGTQMLGLPVHPRLARLLLAAACDGRAALPGRGVGVASA